MSSEKQSLAGFVFSHDSKIPAHAQIAAFVRDGVAEGSFLRGSRFASTRLLAQQAGCSRTTILLAFEQLVVEGYLTSEPRRGYTVATDLPSEILLRNRSAADVEPKPNKLSQLGERLAAVQKYDLEALTGFSPGFPDVQHFPFEVWARLFRRYWSKPNEKLLRSRSPAGYMPLRAAIADHLRASRGLLCEPAQIMVTNGTAHSLALVARLLADPGQDVWIENPSSFEARGALTSAGLNTIPVPVDREGLRVDEGRRLSDGARLVVVAPTHQYPLGSLMSLSRRTALLKWARENDAWICEDDYDSEFRYTTGPLATLYSLDHGHRVLYLGTFSKSLFPNLRLGYIVLPLDVAERFSRARAHLDGYTSMQLQPVLADFIREGHLASHVRRMRKLYARRQAHFFDQASIHLADLVKLLPNDAGLHLVGHLTEALAARMSDVEASERSLQANIQARALSRFYIGPADQTGLLFGYAAMSEAQAEDALRRLGQILRA